MPIREMIRNEFLSKRDVEYALNLINIADEKPLNPRTLPKAVGVTMEEAQAILRYLVQNGVLVRRHGHKDYVNSYWRKEFLIKISDNNMLHCLLGDTRRKLESANHRLEFYLRQGERKKKSDATTEPVDVEVDDEIVITEKSAGIDAIRSCWPERTFSEREKEVLMKWKVDEWDQEELATFVRLAKDFEKKFIVPFVYDEKKTSINFDLAIKRGFASAVVSEGEHETTVGYILSIPFVSEFYGGREDLIRRTVVDRYANVIMPSDIDRKELYFSGEAARKMTRLMNVVSPEHYSKVLERQRQRGRRGALLFLFDGEPGTGKTELCRQMALASGRPLVCADSSKLNGCWHGEAEKNYRGLFRMIRYVTAIRGVSPIILFNEADGIIKTRDANARQSCEQLNNTVQSILLEELECFEGVFVATTNLKESIDPAFMNRFIDKIHFPMPDAAVRLQIWKAQLPQLSDELAGELSRRYTLSGRSIANIASRCDTDDILEGVFPTRERILSYCDEETVTQYHEEPSGPHLAVRMKHDVNN